MFKCINCNKDFYQHNASSRACPFSRKDRTGGYSWDATKVYTEPSFMAQVKMTAKKIRETEYCECGCKGSKMHSHRGIGDFKQVIQCATNEELYKLGNYLAKMKLPKKLGK